MTHDDGLADLLFDAVHEMPCGKKCAKAGGKHCDGKACAKAARPAKPGGAHHHRH